MSAATIKADRKGESIATLRRIFPEGSTVSTVLLSVSSSGMSRRIMVIGVQDGEPVNVSWYVAHALGLPLVESHGWAVRVHGAGMDMGFSIAYDLSSVLFGDGYALRHRWL